MEDLKWNKQAITCCTELWISHWNWMKIVITWLITCLPSKNINLYIKLLYWNSTTNQDGFLLFFSLLLFVLLHILKLLNYIWLLCYYGPLIGFLKTIDYGYLICMGLRAGVLLNQLLAWEAHLYMRQVLQLCAHIQIVATFTAFL